MPSEVHIDALAIPDRVDEDGKCRIAIQLVPTMKQTHAGVIDANNWPREINKRVKKVRLHVGSLGEDGRVSRLKAVDCQTDLAEIFGPAQGQSGSSGLLERANSKWRETFLGGTNGDPWSKILGDMAIGNGEGALEALFMRQEPSVFSPPGTVIEELLERLYKTAQQVVVDDEIDRVQTLKSLDFGRGIYRPTHKTLFPWRDLATALRLEERRDHCVFTRRESYATLVDAKQAPAGASRTALIAQMEAAVENAVQARVTLDRFFDRNEEPLTAKDALDALLEKAMELSESTTALDEFSQALLGTDNPDPNQKAPEDSDGEPEEFGQRKLGTILSFPTIAKYFGMCADITFSPDSLLGIDNAVLAVEIISESGAQARDDELAWTAFRLERTQAGELFFVPQSSNRQFRERKIDVGMVDLNEQLAIGLPAYKLSTNGTPHTLARLDEKARLVSERIATGRMNPEDPIPLPAKSTRGMVLYYKNKKADQISRKAAEAVNAFSELKVSYAQDLFQGMRVDVHLDAIGSDGPKGSPDETRWRPLTERFVRYAKEDIDQRFLNNPMVARLNYRDNAIVTAPPEEKTVAGEVEDWVWEEEFIWGGSSMAAPSPQEPIPLTKDDVPISITISLPDSAVNPTACCPPLRLGRAYRLRARAALPMGCGLTFDDAEQASWRDAHAFPQFSTNNDFIYHRHEAIGAPPVLLPWDSPLVTMQDAQPARAEIAVAAEVRPSPELMVAGDDWRWPGDRRILIPPRLALDEAEQQGQHDREWSGDPEVPEGAFEQDIQIALCGEGGVLPEARGGKIIYQVGKSYMEYDGTPTGRPHVPDGSSPRGAVFLPDARFAGEQRKAMYRLKNDDHVPQPRYYPDAWSRQMVARLKPVEGFSVSNGQRQFYFWPRDDASSQRSAKPVQIELRANRNIKGARIGDPAPVRIRVPGTSRPIEIDNISVDLGPGEIVDLEIFTRADNEGIATAHGAAYPLEKLDNSEHIPIPQLVHTRVLRLVHPVRQPIVPPQIRFIDSRPYTLHIEEGEAVGAVSEPRESRFSLAEALASTDGQEGGAQTLFIGRIHLNGRTTSKLRIDASWRDFGPDTIRQDEQTGLWVEAPTPQIAQLFEVEPDHDEDDLDLAIDPQSNPRGTHYSFPDNRARRLELRPVAASRFSDFYPGEDGLDGQRPTGKLASTEVGGETEVHWVKCGFRPDAPSIDRLLPVFFNAENRSERRTTTFARRSAIRIFLHGRSKQGPEASKGWFHSGEGEKLALVFDHKSDRNPCEYFDEANPISRFARLLTRWGRDPVQDTAPSGTKNLRPRHIRGAKIITDLKLYTETKMNGTSPSKAKPVVPYAVVDAAILEPVLDPELGLYCDVEIGDPDQPPSRDRAEKDTHLDNFEKGYMPFVTLGLARYQEHALEHAVGVDCEPDVDCRLSHVAPKTIQVLPYRHGTVRRIGIQKVRIEIRGQISRPRPEIFDSELEVRLLELKRAAPYPSTRTAWFPVSISGREIVHHAIRLSEEKYPAYKKNAVDGLVWELEFDLPTFARRPRFAVQIDEYELLDVVDDVHAASDKPHCERRGPVFSKFVELRD